MSRFTFGLDYTPPKAECGYDIVGFENAYAKAVTLLESRCPEVLTGTRKDGTPYKHLSPSGYVVLQPDPKTPVFIIGLHKKHRQQLRLDGEEDTISDKATYSVSFTLPYASCTCPAYDKSNIVPTRRYCKHILAIALLHNHPITRLESGLLKLTPEPVAMEGAA